MYKANQVGDFRLSPLDIRHSDFPYGATNHAKMYFSETCIGVVRAALKKAKANL